MTKAMTEELFREDSYMKSCKAKVVAVDGLRVELDRTVFYPTSGGQPGDVGVLVSIVGGPVRVVDCYKDAETGTHYHVLAEGVQAPKVGELVSADVDWERRHRHMRMHSALHLLCSMVDAGVTGGSINAEKGRLDFDLDEAPDKEALTAKLNELVEKQLPIGHDWITDEQLDANPDLVRTMSVQPPRGEGRVRLVEVAGVDLQPCGGTHVKNTSEIGRLRVGKIEKKGRMNRRINIHFDEG